MKKDSNNTELRLKVSLWRNSLSVFALLLFIQTNIIFFGAAQVDKDDTLTNPPNIVQPLSGFFGDFATAIWIDDCTDQDFSDGEFYNVTGTGVDLINNDESKTFDSRDFGSFVQNSNTFWLRGAEMKTFKNPANSNVCIPRMFYRVYEVSATPGAFLPAGGWELNFRANCDLSENEFTDFGNAPCSNNGDQLWQCVTQPECNPSVNLTSFPPGDYRLEVYFEIPGSTSSTDQCNESVFVSNSGANYSAFFTIVSAGSNGTLVLCEGETPTEAQLFNALNGNPTEGGTWTQDELVYTYTVESGACNPTSANVTVSFQAPPNAGEDGTLEICETTTLTNAMLFEALNGSPETGGEWTNVGNNYTYTVEATAPCLADASAIVTVSLIDLKNPAFDPYPSFCEGATIPALPTTSLNDVVGSWSPAINNSSTTTYIFTPQAGECANTADLEIVITPLITPSFNSVDPICEGESLDDLPETSLNDIDGTWSPAINNSATTTYTFTPEDGACANTTTLQIIVNEKTTPSFSPVGPFCLGATVSDLPLTSNNNIEGTWTPAINETETTTYTFIPNAGQCAEETELTIVIFSSPEITNQPSDATLCYRFGIQEETIITSNVIAGDIVWEILNDGTWETVSDGFPEGISYENETTSNLTIVGSPNLEVGIFQYRMMLSDANSDCSINSEIATLTVMSGYRVAPLGPQCSGSELNFEVFPSDGATYAWNVTTDAGTAAEPTTGNTFDFSVVLENNNNAPTTIEISGLIEFNDEQCEFIFTPTIFNIPSLEPVATPDAVCAGESIEITLSGTPESSVSYSAVNASSPNPVELDENGEGTILFENTDNSQTIQIIQVSTPNCSEDINQSIELTVHPLPDVSAGNDIEICEGNEITLNATGASNYSWTNDVENGVSFIPNIGETQFNVIGTDENGCSAEDSVLVQTYENPSFSISPASLTVCSDTDLEIEITPSGGSEIYTGTSWSNDGAAFLDDTETLNPTFTSSESGTFTLTFTLTDNNNCFSIENYDVQVIGTPTLEPIADSESCESFVLPEIQGENLTGNEAFYTDSQANEGIIVTGEITNSGTYYVFDGADGCSDEISFSVIIHSLPEASFNSETASYCDFEEVDDILVSVLGIGEITLNFLLNGQENEVITSNTTANLGNSAGTFTLTEVSDENCSSSLSETITIQIITTPNAPSVTELFKFCSTEELTEINVTGSGGIITWYLDEELTEIYQTGSSISPINEVGEINYFVTETNQNCESFPSQMTITIEDCELIIATAITPDGDGNNDVWIIPGLDEAYPDNKVFIYNRWGNQVFEHASSNGNKYNDNPWDGTYQGQLLPAGSYYYIIHLTPENKINGAISIITN